MTTTEVQVKCNTIERLMQEIGDHIRDASKDSDADLYCSIVRRTLGNGVADRLWDHFVDWDNIRWER